MEVSGYKTAFIFTLHAQKQLWANYGTTKH